MSLAFLVHSHKPCQVVQVHQGTHLVFVQNIKKTNLHCLQLLKVFCIRVIGHHLVDCLPSSSPVDIALPKFVMHLSQFTVVGLMSLYDFSETQLGRVMCLSL